MPDPSETDRRPGGAGALGERSVAVSGNNYGAINTGVIVNIHGDDIQRQREAARVILAATLLAPPLDPERKKAIARYYRGIAKALTETAKALRQGTIPHGKCGEMLGYAEQLQVEIGDVIGQEQANALSRKLLESYALEHAGDDLGELSPAERDLRFGLLDEAAGYFRAAARSLQVRR